MPMVRKSLVSVFVIAALATFQTVAVSFAAAPAQVEVSNDGGERARISVRIIHATRGDAGVDPALERAGLGGTLKKTFKDYKTFRLLDTHAAVAEVGKTQTVKLPNGADLSYQFLGTVGGFLEIHLDVGGMKSTVKVKDGGLFFQAGRGYKDGMIILAFSGEAG